MILILGTMRDSGIGHLVYRLLDRDVPFLVLDPREHGTGFHLTWGVTDNKVTGQLIHSGSTTDFSEIGAVYVHQLWVNPGESRFSPAVTHSHLHSFLETAPFPVCNKPSSSATNMSKTYQQQIIAAHGFMVPRTLVTNIPEKAVEFFESCRGRVIYKSLSARRSIVRRLKAEDLERLDLLANGPTQFQEWVPGTDIRVHVMGNKVFPTEIETEATDYRYSNRDGLPRSMRAVQIPDEVAQRCIELTRSLDMLTAGVDLRRSLDGRYYCFEANPTPAFAFYEQYTSQRITDGLIDALLEASAGKTIPITQERRSYGDKNKVSV
ncbi:MAG: ATP-grasp domain-containing protein [Acidobacteriota bacterium]